MGYCCFQKSGKIKAGGELEEDVGAADQRVT